MVVKREILICRYSFEKIIFYFFKKYNSIVISWKINGEIKYKDFDWFFKVKIKNSIMFFN